MRVLTHAEKDNLKVAGVITMVSLVTSLIVFLTISDEVKTIFIKLVLLHLVLSIILCFFCKKALVRIQKEGNSRFYKFKRSSLYPTIVIVGTYLITFMSYYLFIMILQCSVPITVYFKSALPIVLIAFIGNLMIDFVQISKQKKTIHDQAEIQKMMNEKAGLNNLKMQTDVHFVSFFLNISPNSFCQGSDARGILANDFTKIYRYSLDTFKEDWVTILGEINVVDNNYQLVKASFPDSINNKKCNKGKLHN